MQEGKNDLRAGRAFGKDTRRGRVSSIFRGLGGPERALDVARARRGRWFDPALVDCLCRTAGPGLWDAVAAHDLNEQVAAAEPVGLAIEATEERLDRIATGFAWVIDAKSSFTYQHSERVAGLAVRIGAALGCTREEQVRLRRAGLLHDIGKLSLPNSILDKPGRLTEAEWSSVREHPFHTQQILERVPLFRELAEDASNHHERLDGKGYFRGLTGDRLTKAARILAVADVIDALGSDRPYRPALPTDRLLAMIAADRGTALCPDAVDAAAAVLESRPPNQLASARDVVA